MLEQHPIIVNEKMEIIDGQNRLEAAKALQVVVFYFVIETANLDEVNALNINMRAWISMDFLNSYIDKGLKDYKLLKEFVLHYNLTIPIGMYLLTGISSRSSKRADLYEQFRS